MTVLTKEVPDVAFKLGFHAMTSLDMHKAQRDMVESRPKCGFEGIEEGKTYLYKNVGRESVRVFSVRKIAPSRRQADVIQYPNESEFRIHKGSFGGQFSELDADIISLLGTTHESVVEEAVSRGMDVPNVVRREHPQFFINIPDRFAKPGEYGGETPEGRVRTTLAPSWGKRASEETVLAWIERAHADLVNFLDERIRRSVVNPSTSADYDRAEREFHELIDFYRWLLPHVAPGGALYLESE